MIRISLTFLFILLSCSVARANETITLSTHLAPNSLVYKTTKAILTEAFRRVGKDLILRATPGERPIIEAENGKTDGDAHRIFDIIKIKKLKNLVRVPEVQQVISDYAWSKTVNNLDDGWEGLDKYRVGVHSGSILISEKATQYAKSVTKVGKHDLLFEMLKLDRFDILITTPSAAEVLKTNQFKNSGIRKIGKPLTSLPIYTYLHKRHKDLVSKLAQALRSMKADGSYDKILSKFD
ncbi:conserved exported hypothetical protein [Candidatus Terasakiella magnetica]|uniref:Uncharacterized protein n=1 Tax=Candidatus Terasakiella magnetica TaxID=1867952 RepID=A0A1C3RF53_9PROT|nr:transporter substrate-binding domain-containing protein [Candidatus Terasakiella magnetica]SCA55885.1 conserved exported hypothetical protein [Candidatus Terasakiella magnetica]